MFYHCRRLKHARYGKVQPHIEPGNDFNTAYRWLGYYCGYCPQIWLSSADSHKTGMRNRRDKRNKDDVLFGFNVCKGFPVSFDSWCVVLPTLANVKDSGDLSKATLDKVVIDELKDLSDYMKEDEDYSEDEDPLCGCTTLDDYLEQVLFVEKDQFVLPSLNLKAAKQIICRNERQKKELRRIGFIEDRIQVMRFRRSDW